MTGAPNRGQIDALGFFCIAAAPSPRSCVDLRTSSDHLPCLRRQM